MATFVAPSEAVSVSGIGDDAPVREVALSSRGHEAISATRRVRRELVAELSASHGAGRIQAARELLLDTLEDLGAMNGVLDRTIRLQDQ